MPLLQGGRIQRREDRRGIAAPILILGAQLGAALAGQRVELGLAVVFRCTPSRGNPATLFEPVQRGVERAFDDRERVVGRLSV